MGFLSSRSLEFLIYKVRVIIIPSQGSMRICVCVLSHIQLFETPVDYSPPGSSVPGILQARTPEWVAISFSKYTTGGFSQQARTWAQQKGARPALAPDIDGLPAGNSQVPTPAVAEQSTSGRAI